MKCKLKEPFNAVSHMVGAIISVVFSILLVRKSVLKASLRHITAFTIYGISLTSLYTASTVYHAIPTSDKWTRILRKIDHSMIYVLIAGTYTPLFLIAINGVRRRSLLIGIWIFALIGIFMTIFWLDAPRWFSTIVYVVMGWFGIVALDPVYDAIGLAGIMGILIGGLFYSIGAVIYATKWPKLDSKILGFHEIFHLFVIGGSLSHIWVMDKLVLPLP